MNVDRQNSNVPKDDAEIELPLVKLSKEDVYGALFVHTGDAKDLYKDALLKFQTWIVNFSEEQVKPLRESGCFTEDEIEQIKKKSCVISPITLTLYIHYDKLHMDHPYQPRSQPCRRIPPTCPCTSKPIPYICR